MCRNENEVSSCSGVKHCLGVKTAPFPVMSVMNVTTVISNSRGKKNLKMPVHSKPIIFVLCSKILHIHTIHLFDLSASVYILPVYKCIYIRPIFRGESGVARFGISEYRTFWLFWSLARNSNFLPSFNKVSQKVYKGS